MALRMLLAFIAAAAASQASLTFVLLAGGHTELPRAARLAAHPADALPLTEQANSALAVAVLVGLLAGLASAPQIAAAVPRASSSDFSLERPAYMQGVDASNAATKPGHIDFVTRSRMEAGQFSQAAEEAKRERVLIESAVSKEARVESQRAMALAYAKDTLPSV
mmetsp:Transcript_4717/g.11096  ORF Transcript_4717/g.11096 Transcript_4717/m.11096 type:complete len:165 (-) Transcript_4717:50-544(-)